MTVDQISVFVENNPGRLAETAGLLAEASINIRAMSIADTADFGVLRLIVGDAPRAADILRAAGCIVSITQVLAVAIDDAPGGLVKILRVFSDAGINIEYLYAFITRKKENAYVIFRVEDNERAIELLTLQGVKLAGMREIYDL